GASTVLAEAKPSPLAPPQQAGELGRIGPYRILEVLGTGGMSIVYRAWQPLPQRQVALKISHGRHWASPQRLPRVRGENELIALLRHPTIVPIYEAGEHDGQPYYTMEHLEGGSLAQKLAVASMPARAAAELVQTLARAVHFAHEHGVVHRDLKPG